MLGRAWETFLDSRDIPHDAVARNRTAPNALDLGDPRAIECVVRRGYRWVVNCAAYTAVDAAESDEEGAIQVNGEAVGDLARSAAKHGATLIHYSTDYVFNGNARTPYAVNAPLEPVNAYGRSKALGEVYVRNASEHNLVIRTSWVYAPWGNNFVLTMRRLLRSQSQICVVDDQRGRPTSVFTLVDATWALMQHGANGTYHVADAGTCTWCEFAQEIGRIEGATCRVLPCTTHQFPRPAKRPAYSVLDTSSTEAVVGTLPDWHYALRRVLDQCSAQDI